MAESRPEEQSAQSEQPESSASSSGPEPRDAPGSPETPEAPEQPVTRIEGSRAERRAAAKEAKREERPVAPAGKAAPTAGGGVLSDVPMDDGLEEAVDKLTTFWSKFGNEILYAIIAVCVVILANNWIRGSVETAREEAWSDLVATTTPQGFDQVAELYDRPGVHYHALLDAGDLYHAEALQTVDDAEAPTDGNSDSPDGSDGSSTLGGLSSLDDGLSRSELLDKALDRYQRVVDETAAEVGQSNAALVVVGLATRYDMTVYRINGLIGVAAVQLSRGEFDAAETAYQQAFDLAESSGYAALAEIARVGLERLPVVQQPLVLAPTPSFDTDSTIDVMGDPIRVTPGGPRDSGRSGADSNPLDLGTGSPAGAPGMNSGLDLDLDLDLDLNRDSGTGSGTDDTVE